MEKPAGGQIPPMMWLQVPGGGWQWGRDPASCAAQGLCHLCHPGGVLPVPTGVTHSPGSTGGGNCDKGEGLTGILQLWKDWVRDVWGLVKVWSPGRWQHPGPWRVAAGPAVSVPSRDSPALSPGSSGCSQSSAVREQGKAKCSSRWAVTAEWLCVQIRWIHGVLI